MSFIDDLKKQGLITDYYTDTNVNQQEAGVELKHAEYNGKSLSDFEKGLDFEAYKDLPEEALADGKPRDFILRQDLQDKETNFDRAEQWVQDKMEADHSQSPKNQLLQDLEKNIFEAKSNGTYDEKKIEQEFFNDVWKNRQTEQGKDLINDFEAMGKSFDPTQRNLTEGFVEGMDTAKAEEKYQQRQSNSQQQATSPTPQNNPAVVTFNQPKEEVADLGTGGGNGGSGSGSSGSASDKKEMTADEFIDSIKALPQAQQMEMMKEALKNQEVQRELESQGKHNDNNQNQDQKQDTSKQLDELKSDKEQQASQVESAKQSEEKNTALSSSQEITIDRDGQEKAETKFDTASDKKTQNQDESLDNKNALKEAKEHEEIVNRTGGELAYPEESVEKQQEQTSSINTDSNRLSQLKGMTQGNEQNNQETKSEKPELTEAQKKMQEKFLKGAERIETDRQAIQEQKQDQRAKFERY